MSKKLIIEEIRRIQEVMFGEAIISEAATGVNKFLDLILAMLKMSKSAEDGKNAVGIQRRLDDFLAQNKFLGNRTKKFPNGKPITKFEDLKNIDHLKAVVTHLSKDVDIIRTIMTAIRADYKTSLLSQGDVGYEIQKFVKTLQGGGDDVVSILHKDFFNEFNKTMKEIDNPDGILKAMFKYVAADFKNAWGMMSNAENVEKTTKILANLEANFLRMTATTIKNIVISPWSLLKWVAAGKMPDKLSKAELFWKVSYRVGKQLLALTAIVTVGEALQTFLQRSNSLLDDEGELYASLPQEAKMLFCLPEADGKAAAQDLWDELQSANPSETNIQNILTQNNQGSKLIANQIAYEFGELASNKGDLSLMDIMNKNMNFYLDQIPSAVNKLTGIPTTSVWYESWTASDIMRVLNNENFPAVNAPMLELSEKMEQLAKKGIEAIAGYAAFRIEMPKSMKGGKQALYSRLGRYMTPKQTAWLQMEMDNVGMTGENASSAAFISALNQMERDDFANQGVTTGFVIMDGVWANGVFKPKDENKIPGISYNCADKKCVKKMDDSGEYQTKAGCQLNCEISTENNEGEIQSQIKALEAEVESMFENLFFGVEQG